MSRARAHAGRVLVVDDQPSMALLLERILGDEGFEVVSAGTAQAAMDQYARCRPDCVLIDYRLPDENGLRLWAKLVELDPNCRGILMTSYGSDELRARALRAGMAAYLAKPFDNDVLVALLRRTTGVEIAPSPAE